jgi:hypothetical protein
MHGKTSVAQANDEVKTLSQSSFVQVDLKILKKVWPEI